MYKTTILVIVIISLIAFGLGCKSSTSSIPKLQQIVDQYHEDLNAGALSVSIFYPDESEVITLNSGTQSKSNKKPIDAQSLFEIASITKSFVSVILLQMETDGKLNLDDSFRTLTKRYPNWLKSSYLDRWQDVTVRQLLNMTSGIYSYTSSPQFNAAMKQDPTGIWNPEKTLSIAFNHPDEFRPGQGWSYSDTNYIIAGILIEIIEQKPFQQVLEERILNRSNLGLNNTYYHIGNSPLPNLVAGYDANGSDVPKYNLSSAGPAGAMISTSADLVKWVRALFTGDLLSKQQRQQLMTTVSTTSGKVTIDPKETAFGLGVLRTYISERDGINWMYLGGSYGFLAYYCWIPKTNIVIAVTINTGSDPDDVSKIPASTQVIQKDLVNSIYRVLKEQTGSGLTPLHVKST